MADLGSLVHHGRAENGPDHAGLAALACRQHGVVARHQLVELGFGRGSIASARAKRRLHRVHRAVFALGHDRLTWRGQVMAAVLACGDQALASHRTAAALWEIADAGRLVDVSASRSRAGHPGIALHRVRGLDPDEQTLRDEIPVTTVGRTLLDLAEVVDETRLSRALERAERLRIFDLREMERVCRRRRGRRGLGRLSAVLSGYREPPPNMRSELERRFLHSCRAAGIAEPAVGVWIEGQEVDFFWDGPRLVIELDSWEYHRTREAFERDRARDARLQMAGVRVLRLTARRLDAELDDVIETVRNLAERPG